MRWQERAVINLFSAWTQHRALQRWEPTFNTLNNLEKLYASLDYTAPDTRLVVVRTNMGLCLQSRSDECKR